MGEFLNNLTSLERILIVAIVISYTLTYTARIVLWVIHSRLSKKLQQKRERLEILNKRQKGVQWPTNEQIRIYTKHVEESGDPDDKKLLSAMMKAKEFSGGDGTTKIPEGVQREIVEALEIIRKANSE